MKLPLDKARGDNDCVGLFLPRTRTRLAPGHATFA